MGNELSCYDDGCSCELCLLPTRRQYFSPEGPGYENRFFQSDYNPHTDEVESDEPYRREVA